MDIRCTTCRAEFSLEDERMKGRACPVCGAEGIPMLIKDDTTIRINVHELRVLTIWAMNWAQSVDREAQRCVSGIINALRPQVDQPLTLGEELADVVNSGVAASIEVHGPQALKDEVERELKKRGKA